MVHVFDVTWLRMVRPLSSAWQVLAQYRPRWKGGVPGGMLRRVFMWVVSDGRGGRGSWSGVMKVMDSAR